MDNIIIINKGVFEVSRVFGIDKTLNQVVEEKVLEEVKFADILTKEDKKGYNN